MSLKNGDIPIHSADGRSLGFRTLAVAQKLLAGGHVHPAYGPRKQLKALFLKQADGSSPIEATLRVGTRYSFHPHLESGHRAWRHKQVEGNDEDGTVVTLRDAFECVVRECLK